MKKTILFLAVLFLLSAACHADITVYVVPAITDNKILPNTSISSAYISNTISVRGSPGEYMPASFVVYSPANISSMTVTVSDLTGSGGTINSSAVDVRVVKVWYQICCNFNVNINPAGYKPKVLVPELLLKDDSLVKVVEGENYLKLTNGSYRWVSEIKEINSLSYTTIEEEPVQDSATLLPVNISAGTNKQFWITIKVPDNATAGIYNGTIRLGNASGPFRTIQFQLTVLPIDLAQSYLEYSMFYLASLDGNYPNGSMGLAAKSEEQMEAELKNMREHGVTNPIFWHAGSSKTPNIPKSQKMLELRNNAGMSGPLYGRQVVVDDYGTNVTAWKAAISNYMNFSSPYGYPSYYVYGKDENDVDSNEITMIQAAHDMGAKFFVSQNTPEMADYAAQYVDTVSYYPTGNISVASQRALTAKYHQYGHRLYRYGWPFCGVERPETYRRHYGINLWQLDYDGDMNLGYQFSYADSWNDFDHPVYKDAAFVYPTLNGVVDTVQWEGHREATTDIRYLTTLNNTINAAKSRGRNTSAAETWLANLKDYDLTDYGRAGIDLNSVRDIMVGYILALQDEESGLCVNVSCGPVCDGVNLLSAGPCKNALCSYNISQSCAYGCSGGVCNPAPAAGRVSFVSPAPANGTVTCNSFFEANVGLGLPGITGFVFGLNGVNYSFYDDSLLLAMNYNNNSAIGETSSKAVDISRYSNNGTIYSAKWSDAGRLGGAILFDGVDDYVNAGSAGNLAPAGGSITMEAWVNPVGAHRNDYGAVFYKRGDANTGYQMYVSSYGKLVIAQGWTAGHYWVTNLVVPSNQWNHVVGIIDSDSGAVTGYVNGVGESSNITASSFASGTPVNLLIGGNAYANYYAFNGYIDELRLYGRELSPREVALHYQSELKKQDASTWMFYCKPTIDPGANTYYASVVDPLGTVRSTGARTITFNTDCAASTTTTTTSSTTTSYHPTTSSSTSSTSPFLTTTSYSTSSSVLSSTSFVVSSTSTFSSTSTTRKKIADANLDGFVNYEDLLILAASYDRHADEAGFDVRADFDGDGEVGYRDLIVLANNYGI